MFVFHESIIDLSSNASDEPIEVEMIASRTTRHLHTRQLQTRSRLYTVEQQTDDLSSSVSEQNLEIFSRVTNNGNTIMNLIKRIERIMNTEEAADMESPNCIICCENKKSVILFPCRHQHTCESCWSLWGMQTIAKFAYTTFDENDENAKKPACPYCNSHVDSSVTAIN